MNSKAATLGISAAVIGGLAAALTAVAATMGRSRQAATGGTDAPGAPTGQAAAQAAPQPGGRAAAPTTIAPNAGAAPSSDGHSAADLAAGVDMGPDHRAPAAFRPDMDAPMTPAEREALRPPVGAPSLSGASTSQPTGS